MNKEQALTATLTRSTEMLNEVVKERDALIAELGQPVPLSEWQQMVAERDSLKADAERYRWLRERDLPWSHKSYPQSMVVTRWSSDHSPDEIDAAIDEAIRSES